VLDPHGRLSFLETARFRGKDFGDFLPGELAERALLDVLEMEAPGRRAPAALKIQQNRPLSLH
jgi:hypothetical protein